jgi:hypothetical protein
VASLALPWFAPPEILSLEVATFKGGRSTIGFNVWTALAKKADGSTLKY